LILQLILVFGSLIVKSYLDQTMPGAPSCLYLVMIAEVRPNTCLLLRGSLRRLVGLPCGNRPLDQLGIQPSRSIRPSPNKVNRA
jgi:hypothetical protein